MFPLDSLKRKCYLFRTTLTHQVAAKSIRLIVH